MKRLVRGWLWRVPLEREVEDEIAFHLEMRIRELVEGGMDPRAARELALARAGDLEQLKRMCIALARKRDREMNLRQWLEELRDDVRFAIRQLRRSPAFTLVAVLTLALGIGVNSAMFALADATMLRSLPFTDAGRLVMLWESREAASRVPVNPVDFLDWSERNRTFEALASVVGSGHTFVRDDGRAEQVAAHAVSARFFDVLRVRPIAGRTFRDSDGGPDASVVVLSEEFWRSRFGGDQSLIGRQITLDKRRATVIGIVPAGFQFELPATGTPGAISLWRLRAPPPDRSAAERYPHYMQVFGRLKAGVTLEAARSDMSAIAAALARESPATNQGHGVTVEWLREGLIAPELRRTSMLLLGVVGFVLLMCCTNVASLLLAQTTGRARELAVRSALGAGQPRIVRQVLTESLVLAVLGGTIGVGIGAGILKAAPSLIPRGLVPATIDVGFDGRVLAFCAVSACVVAILFGLAPAWQAMRMTLVQAMSLDGRTTTARGSWFRSALAAVEVATAVLLLFGAGLLLRTLMAIGDVDPGYRATNAVTLNLGISPQDSAYRTPHSWRQFYEAVEREVKTIPGVRNAGWGSALPLDGRWYGQMFQIVGDPPKPEANRDSAAYQIVSPSYFQTLEAPMLQGRGFTDRDREDAPSVCIVDEAFVRRYLGNRSPLGMRVGVVPMGTPQGVEREIVGVVSQLKERPDEVEAAPHIYVPLAQNPWWSASLVVRPTEGSATALVPAIRAAAARVDRNRPLTRIRTLDDVGWEATSRPRFRALIVSVFASLALVLALVGVFGVLAQSVEQRRREFGVRLALGASPGHVLGIVFGTAARIIAAGTSIGLVLAAALGMSLTVFLFGVRPLDPMTFLAVPALLALTAAVAAAIPALRAMRVDPVVTFRNE